MKKFPPKPITLQKILAVDLKTAPWHVKLQIKARQGNILARFLARRLQSNWQTLQPFLSTKPMTMVFTIDANNPKPFHINPADATYRSYYAPKPPGYLEPELLTLLPLLLGKKGNFWDVGANWGFYTHVAALQPGFKGKIETFEPNPTVFKETKRIAQELKLDNTTVHNYGASNHTTQAKMGGLGRTGDTSTGMVGSGDINIQLKQLDNQNLPKPTLIKLDVENHEHEALQGMAKTLKQHQPYLFIESWGPNISPEVDESYPALQFLLDHGYTLLWPQLKENHLHLTPLTLAERQHHKKLLNLLALPTTKLDTFTKLWHS